MCVYKCCGGPEFSLQLHLLGHSPRGKVHSMICTKCELQVTNAQVSVVDPELFLGRG